MNTLTNYDRIERITRGLIPTWKEIELMELDKLQDLEKIDLLELNMYLEGVREQLGIKFVVSYGDKFEAEYIEAGAYYYTASLENFYKYIQNFMAEGLRKKESWNKKYNIQ